MRYLDSGCSRHMMRDKSKLNSLRLKRGGNVTLKNNTTYKVFGSHTIGIKIPFSKKCFTYGWLKA